MKVSQLKDNTGLGNEYHFFKNVLSNSHTRGEEFKLKIHQIANNNIILAGKTLIPIIIPHKDIYIYQFKVLLNDRPISAIEIPKDLTMTLQDLRKEIDNKEIDIPKDRNYEFVINESANFEKQDEFEI